MAAKAGALAHAFAFCRGCRLERMENDHRAADLHLDEFDRHELEKEYPEMAADRVPTVEEIRSRFDMIAGGML